MKFLIVRLGSLGDIVHALPLVNCLRDRFPESQIDWLVGKVGYEFLSLIKELNNIYSPTFENMKLIRKQNYDYVIDVQGLFKSGFLSRLSGGKKIIGFKNTREFADLFYDLKVNVGSLFKTKEHIIDLNLKLVSSITENDKIKFLIPKISSPSTLEIVQKVIDKYSNRSLPSILIFPGTRWESKLWSMNYWHELIKLLSNNFKVFIAASSGDLKYVQSLIDKLDSDRVSYQNFIGKTKITDLIYLIQNADLVIGMDSFGLHLASAIRNDYGLPEVMGIYGPTSPFRTGPYNAIDNCLYLSHLDCIACRKKSCPLGHHNCMKNILPIDVCKKINSLNIKGKVHN